MNSWRSLGSRRLLVTGYWLLVLRSTSARLLSRLSKKVADAGPTVENWVFGELRKVLPVEAGIHFWRSTSKAEVDFVVEIASAVVGLEVKAGPVGRPSISRSVHSFIEAYQPQSFLIVSTHRFDKKQLGSTEVSWITLDEVASTLQRLMAGSS